MVRHGFSNAMKGNKRYPYVLMLEPLYTCNLACLGCSIERHTGKLKDRMSVQECLAAVDESGAPTVSICGGEPTIYPELPELLEGIIWPGIAGADFVIEMHNESALAKRILIEIAQRCVARRSNCALAGDGHQCYSGGRLGDPS